MDCQQAIDAVMHLAPTRVLTKNGFTYKYRFILEHHDRGYVNIITDHQALKDKCTEFDMKRVQKYMRIIPLFFKFVSEISHDTYDMYNEKLKPVYLNMMVDRVIGGKTTDSIAEFEMAMVLSGFITMYRYTGTPHYSLRFKESFEIYNLLAKAGLHFKWMDLKYTKKRKCRHTWCKCIIKSNAKNRTTKEYKQDSCNSCVTKEMIVGKVLSGSVIQLGPDIERLIVGYM